MQGEVRLQQAGPRVRTGRQGAAFTLLEILLVLGLIGLLASVLVVGVVRLSSDKPASADEVFWGAVTAARKQALLSGHDVRLHFEPRTTDTAPALVASWEGGTQTFPFEQMGDVVCDFLSPQKPSSSTLVGGTLIETQTIPAVTFYGDGTCMPFRAQLRLGGSASVHTLAIDPWTCAQVLVKTGEGT